MIIIPPPLPPRLPAPTTEEGFERRMKHLREQIDLAESMVGAIIGGLWGVLFGLLTTAGIGWLLYRLGFDLSDGRTFGVLAATAFVAVFGWMAVWYRLIVRSLRDERKA